MIGALKASLSQKLAELDSLIQRYSLPILFGLIAATSFQKLALILHTDGGGDLLGADIPKSVTLITGGDPYATKLWASPYPPLLLAVLGTIIRITSGNIPLTPDTISLISRNIRVTGLFADALVAVLVFAGLRTRGISGITALVPPIVFLTLPSISLSPYYWFNSDVLGYPILAGSTLALIKARYLAGTALLATATIFKIHPILAVPLVIVWIIRKNGINRSLRPIIATGSILTLGLAVPIMIPGYVASILGFNLSSGFGAGTSSFTIMNLFYFVFPSLFHLSLPVSAENQIWLATTTTLFVAALGLVWTRARQLNPVDVLAIGLLVWLIPLRQIYTHYIVWAIVPFLMRGRLRHILIVGVLLELANTMASWSWGLPPDPFPIFASGYGFFATSIVYLAVSTSALAFILMGLQSRRESVEHVGLPRALEKRLSPFLGSR